jgi:hypothetical protein
MPVRRPGTMIVTQACGAIAALAALTLWPPSRGKMLLIPVAGADVNTVATIAVAGGAALIGTGPFPGSLVVTGDRAAIVRHIPAWTMIVMAPPPAGCGTVAPVRAA